MVAQTMTARSILPALVVLAAVAAVRPATGASLDELAWLAGDWRQSGDKSFAQEVWLDPMNGSLPGVFRLIQNGRLIVHEYILIAQEDGRIVLRFKHFNADYSTWEGDGPPLTFVLAEVRPGFAMWQNTAPSDEAPDQLRYERSGDRLTVMVMDDTANADAGEPMTFKFRRHPNTSGD